MRASREEQLLSLSFLNLINAMLTNGAFRLAFTKQISLQEQIPQEIERKTRVRSTGAFFSLWIIELVGRSVG